MNVNEVKTIDDFEKLPEDQKESFKSNHNLAYRGLFNLSSTPKKLDWRDNRQEINFYPSDIKTADDFEKLSVTGKLYFTHEHPEKYKDIFRSK